MVKNLPLNFLENLCRLFNSNYLYLSNFTYKASYLQVDSLATDNSKKQVNFKNLLPTKLSVKVTILVGSDLVSKNENSNKENQLPYPMAA